jgi:hypothetical protein
MTSRRSSWIRQQPLVAYFALAFAITWALVSPFVLSSLGWLDVVVPPNWHILGALGPVSAAFIIAAIMSGKRGAQWLLARMVSRDAGTRWLLLSALSPFAMFAGAIWLTYLCNRTGGSILAVALWHTTWSVVNQIVTVVSEDALARMSAVVMIVPIVIVIVCKPARLSAHDKHTLPAH